MEEVILDLYYFYTTITHDALKQCQTNVNDGYVYVVDMDLEKFFDTVYKRMGKLLWYGGYEKAVT